MQLAATLRRQGFDVAIRNGHYHVRDGRRLVTTFGTSPGCSGNRWRKNCEAAVARYRRGKVEA